VHGMKAALAYQARSADRSLREQEADVFRRATAALRVAQSGDETTRIRAVNDNRLLWSTLGILIRDPQNALTAPLRASLVSVGLAVQRELDAPEPDMPFLIGINEQITAGLIGI
jgi:flagellar biosynthesis regulator FlaF